MARQGVMDRTGSCQWPSFHLLAVPSVAVLCGELLREAEHLVNQRVHPQTIAQGWRRAVQIARDALEASSRDNKDNLEMFRLDLLNIARTTLSSKLLNVEKDHFAHLAVDAVLRLKGSGNLDYIQVNA
jgi:T-complex protein 1 subunit beta